MILVQFKVGAFALTITGVGGLAVLMSFLLALLFWMQFMS